MPKSIDNVIIDFTENQFTYKDFIMYLSNTSKQLGKYKMILNLLMKSIINF